MPLTNHFLDSLRPSDMEALRPHLTHVKLRRDDLLDAEGAPVSFVYFPAGCILSVVTVMRSGGQVESRTIGRESAYGLLQILGSPVSFERMIVQVPGEAWRAPLAPLRALALQRPTLIDAVARHAQATLLQAAQSTACNSLHGAEQRLSRWLLLTMDRLGSDILPLTQEHLAIMLGVQRTTISAVASRLQDDGLVSYVRGRIQVLDRAGLERRACECYEAIQHGVAAMLGEEAPARQIKS